MDKVKEAWELSEVDNMRRIKEKNDADDISKYIEDDKSIDVDKEVAETFFDVLDGMFNLRW